MDARLNDDSVFGCLLHQSFDCVEVCEDLPDVDWLLMEIIERRLNIQLKLSRFVYAMHTYTL